MNEIAVTNEAKELLSLCRTGRLYDIEKWITFLRALPAASRNHAIPGYISDTCNVIRKNPLPANCPAVFNRSDFTRVPL